MVSIPERYYVSTDGLERGPFTLGQVASMWSSGILTSTALYRLTNVENWTPLSQLDDTLRFISSSRPVQETDRSKDAPKSILADLAVDPLGPPSSSVAKVSPANSTAATEVGTKLGFPKDFAVKFGQQLAILQDADKLDPSGKTGKQLGDAFLASWESDSEKNIPRVQPTRITGKGTAGEPFFIGLFTAAGLLNGIFMSLEHTFDTNNWGIQEWSHSYDGKTNTLKIAVLRRRAESLYFYVTFWDPIDWRQCSPQERLHYVTQYMNFLIKEKGAKDLQRKFEIKTAVVGVVAMGIVILLIWLFKK